eukprot:1102703-Amphidinium_carterae.2
MAPHLLLFGFPGNSMQSLTGALLSMPLNGSLGWVLLYLGSWCLPFRPCFDKLFGGAGDSERPTKTQTPFSKTAQARKRDAPNVRRLSGCP